MIGANQKGKHPFGIVQSLHVEHVQVSCAAIIRISNGLRESDEYVSTLIVGFERRDRGGLSISRGMRGKTQA